MLLLKKKVFLKKVFPFPLILTLHYLCATVFHKNKMLLNFPLKIGIEFEILDWPVEGRYLTNKRIFIKNQKGRKSVSKRYYMAS